MMIENLPLSGQEIDRELYKLKRNENSAMADILRLLSVLEETKTYRELGYSSLFTYCRERLGYSEGAAYRRVQAARILDSHPEIYGQLKEGKLNLCSVSEIAKVKDIATKSELLRTSEGKSKREVQEITAKHLPAERSKKETIRAKIVDVERPVNLSITSPVETLGGYKGVNEKDDSKKLTLKFNFSMEVDEAFMKLYREAKELIGHAPASEVFRRTLSEFVKRRKVMSRVTKLAEPKNSRFIPKEVKTSVLKRDNHQCSYVSKDGKKCAEKHGLEFDHIKPYALGGDNSLQNVRLLCKAHNLLMAENTFGKRFGI